MVPNAPQLTGQLRQAIYYHLDNGLEENALFLAGRLHAVDSRNAEAVHLLALCHFRLREYKLVYDYSRLLALRGAHIGCAYVFAQACLALEKYTDGIAALERSRVLWEGKSQSKTCDPSRRFQPDTAAIVCLLGKLLHGNGDIKRAVECYCVALKSNPFMWDAFERLCSTGTNIRPSNIFKLTPQMAPFLSNLSNQSYGAEEDRGGSSMQTASMQTASQIPCNAQNLATPGSDPFNVVRVPLFDLKPGHATGSILSKPAPQGIVSNTGTAQGTVAAAETPTTTTSPPQNPIGSSNVTIPSSFEPPNAPLRRPRTVQAAPNEPSLEPHKPTIAQEKTKGTEVTGLSEPADLSRTNSGTNQHKRTLSGTIPQSLVKSDTSTVTAPRRSGRLLRPPSGRLNAPPSELAAKEGRELKKAKPPVSRARAAATTSTVGRVVSGNRKPLEGVQTVVKDSRTGAYYGDTSSMNHKATQQDTEKSNEALHYIFDLLSKVGHGYHALTRFQGQAALQHFYSLPAQQRDTPWVLAQIGKAQYELSNYAEAEKTFSRLKKLVPSRLQDMEVYSTVLYHLKNDAELAFLSHELVDADRLSPQAWCAIGNSLSLQRDHDQALKCFKRATQLSPKFAYGYTLQGHEHMENEEYDKAQAAYRRAISSDHRHYNGWYGLGKVYEKLGKFDMAERHYRFAASINPTNAILVCCIGVVLEKLKKPQAALIQYDHACELAPQSAISRFKKARALLHLGRMREALDEFKVLKDMVPDESNVHFMLGRVYKILHDKASAIRHFTIALNLDPKAAQYIKEAMEALDEDDPMGDDDDEHMS